MSHGTDQAEGSERLCRYDMADEMPVSPTAGLRVERRVALAPQPVLEGKFPA